MIRRPWAAAFSRAFGPVTVNVVAPRIENPLNRTVFV